MKEMIDQLPRYYQDYIHTLDEFINTETGNVVEAMALTYENTMSIFSDIYVEQADYRYAPGKWTIAEVFGHLIDADRISAHRALRISRGEKENQRGWNQDAFATHANYTNREFQSIKQEILSTMESSGYLFEGMSDKQLDTIGLSNGHESTPRVLGYILAGHRQHHLNILRERYLSE